MEEKKIADLLYQLGVHSSYLGFPQVIDCVEMVAGNAAARDMMKAVYIDAAARNQTSKVCVERDIRTLITVIWKSGNRALLEEIAGETLKERPKNREFICMLADYLQRERVSAPAEKDG